jgi:hypothetical protein
MATDEEDFSEFQELCVVKTVLVLNNASVVWRFWEVPYIGVRSLRSANRYLYADGSVAIWDHRLQMWIARPKRIHAHETDTEILLRLIRSHHPHGRKHLKKNDAELLQSKLGLINSIKSPASAANPPLSRD